MSTAPFYFTLNFQREVPLIWKKWYFTLIGAEKMEQNGKNTLRKAEKNQNTLIRAEDPKNLCHGEILGFLKIWNKKNCFCLSANLRWKQEEKNKQKNAYAEKRWDRNPFFYFRFHHGTNFWCFLSLAQLSTMLKIGGIKANKWQRNILSTIGKSSTIKSIL